MTSTTAESFDAPPLTKAPADARHAKALRLWLACLALLIVAMVLVGGATRLTDSGLSITEWKPVTGVIPPLSANAWRDAFDAYQKIPEYLELKRGMSLEEFKSIYWWEWGHRFLGRLIGAAFLIPFLAFWAAGYIPRGWLPRLAGLFVLGALQGAMGWYMVKSGLVARVDVSQYRLAAHLGIAVAILGYTLWLIFDLGPQQRSVARSGSRAPTWVATAVLALVYLQILAGGIVAGIDAGFGYNTWPLINGAFVPNGLGEAQHALLQATLGVWTLLLSVPIELGLAHQAGAILLFAAALYHFWLTQARTVPARDAQVAVSA